MPHATVPPSGLQAFVLCGPGVSLNTFTSNPKDLPKALVPIANRPMVWYALDWCYRMGVHDITLITPAESEPALQSALKTHPALTSLPSPRPEVLAPADLEQTTATGHILRLPEVQKRITSDFVIVPCDLVSELEGVKLIQQWVGLNPLSSSSGLRRKGGFGLFYSTQGLEGISHKKDETDFIATVSLSTPPVPPPHGSLRAHVEQLVLTMPTDTLKDKLEEDKDVLKLRSQLSRKYGKVKLKSKYRDAHVYIFPQWVKDFVAHNERFESISEDVVGWWTKAGWQQGLGQKLGMEQVLVSKRSAGNLESSMTEENHDVGAADAATLSSTKSSRPVSSIMMPTFASRVGSTAPTSKHDLEVPPVLAYIQPAYPAAGPDLDHPLVRRVDTSAAILNVSLYLAKQPSTHVLSPEAKVHATAQIGQQSRVAHEDSLVAENVKIGTRVVVKESVIGANCEIGNNVRLTRCLLMEGVKVGDGVQMIGCIVGRRACIEGMKPADTTTAAGEAAEAPAKARRKKDGADDEEDRTKLTECEVAPNFVVEAGTEAKGEKMMPFDTDDLDDLDEDEDADDEDA